MKTTPLVAIERQTSLRKDVKMEILNYKKMFTSKKASGDVKSEVNENHVDLSRIYSMSLINKDVATMMAYTLSLKVLKDPEESYFCADYAQKKILTALSEDVWLTSIESLKKVVKEVENTTELTISSPNSEDQAKIVGFSTFIGLLYVKHLVDADVIYDWLGKILKANPLHVARINMLEVVKDKVKKAIENGCMDEDTFLLNKAIVDAKLYEEENYEMEAASKVDIVEFNRRRR